LSAHDNKPDKYNKEVEATKEAATTAKEVVKSDSVQITEEAVKAEKAERVAKSKRSRVARVAKASRAVKTNKAEMAAKAERAAKEGKAERAAQAERTERAAKADKAEKAPRQSIFAMDDDAKSTLVDKAADRNKEKSEGAKAAAKNEEATAMLTCPRSLYHL
jgi:hypothetical protein